MINFLSKKKKLLCIILALVILLTSLPLGMLNSYAIEKIEEKVTDAHLSVAKTEIEIVSAETDLEEYINSKKVNLTSGGTTGDMILNGEWASLYIARNGIYRYPKAGDITYVFTGQTVEGDVTTNHYRVDCTQVLVYNEEVTPYEICVGPYQVTSGNANDVLADGKVSYDVTTNTLTLNNAIITSGGGDEKCGFGINYTGSEEFTLVANGVNAVMDNRTRKDFSAGFLVGDPSVMSVDLDDPNVNIVVSENSAITFMGGTVEGGYFPIGYGIANREYGNLTISGKGVLTAVSGSCSNESYGIHGFGDFIVDSTGTIVAMCANGAEFSTGIFSCDIHINSGAIYCAGGDSDNYQGESYGLSTMGSSWLNGDIYISNATINAVGGATRHESYGIFADEAFVVSNSNITASTKATEGKAMAINKAPTFVEETTAAGSVNADGSNPVLYRSEDNNTYKWYKTPYEVTPIRYTITYDLNGGIAGSSFVASEQKDPGTVIYVDNILEEFATPPNNRVLDAWEINGVRYELGSTYTLEGDITVKFLWKLPYVDVPRGTWYYEPVEYVSDAGIITGYNPTLFGVFDNLTREQLVNILWRIEGKPDASALENKFSDVPDESWYTEAIKWASSNNIVKGYGGTTLFGVGDNIIRQDLAIMLTNYAKYKGLYIEPTVSLDNFADKDTVSTYAVDAVRWASENSIISGNANEDGTRTIAPLANAMRCEAAVMLMRFCENILE